MNLKKHPHKILKLLLIIILGHANIAFANLSAEDNFEFPLTPSSIKNYIEKSQNKIFSKQTCKNLITKYNNDEKMEPSINRLIVKAPLINQDNTKLSENITFVESNWKGSIMFVENQESKTS